MTDDQKNYPLLGSLVKNFVFTSKINIHMKPSLAFRLLIITDMNYFNIILLLLSLSLSALANPQFISIPKSKLIDQSDFSSESLKEYFEILLMKYHKLSILENDQEVVSKYIAQLLTSMRDEEKNGVLIQKDDMRINTIVKHSEYTSGEFQVIIKEIQETSKIIKNLLDYWVKLDQNSIISGLSKACSSNEETFFRLIPATFVSKNPDLGKNNVLRVSQMIGHFASFSNSSWNLLYNHIEIACMEKGFISKYYLYKQSEIFPRIVNTEKEYSGETEILKIKPLISLIQKRTHQPTCMPQIKRYDPVLCNKNMEVLQHRKNSQGKILFSHIFGFSSQNFSQEPIQSCSLKGSRGFNLRKYKLTDFNQMGKIEDKKKEIAKFLKVRKQALDELSDIEKLSEKCQQAKNEVANELEAFEKEAKKVEPSLFSKLTHHVKSLLQKKRKNYCKVLSRDRDAKGILLDNLDTTKKLKNIDRILNNFWIGPILKNDPLFLDKSLSINCESDERIFVRGYFEILSPGFKNERNPYPLEIACFNSTNWMTQKETIERSLITDSYGYSLPKKIHSQSTYNRIVEGKLLYSCSKYFNTEQLSKN